MPIQQPIRVALILGSVREGRFCTKIADWAAARIAARSDYRLQVLDPLELGIAGGLSAAAHGVLRRAIADADAFVVVTPEYNHSFPGALKVLIDAVGAEWSAKPVGFISYGGVSGGLRAVEHLRQVFAELHAVGLRDSVALHAPWGGFATPQDSPPGADAALELMLDRMAWWAGALTAARTAIPYVRAA